MTLDQAITHAREKADKAIESEALFLRDDLIWNAKKEYRLAKEHEQIAEWLEELKALRHEANEWRKAGYSHGYNKAIDDFVKACKENIMYKTFGLRECDIEQIAEQLKAGGENE